MIYPDYLQGLETENRLPQSLMVRSSYPTKMARRECVSDDSPVNIMMNSHHDAFP